MKNREKTVFQPSHRGTLSRRQVLKIAGISGITAALPLSLVRKILAESMGEGGMREALSETGYPDWIAEARIYGMAIPWARFNPARTAIELDRVIEQGANVIEADSGLSDYLSEEDFVSNMQIIKETTDLIHDRGLKVVWYIPSLEVVTPNGRFRKDSFGRIHADWLQLSFDGENRAVFYGHKVFWIEKNDESAWLCPNSPFRDWMKIRLRRLSKTGVDGFWLDVPLFDLIVARWGCTCNYCRKKFEGQTGLEFPRKFDISDKRFWRYIQWRHETITEFIEDCKKAIASVNEKAITIAEVVSLDHMGATQHGLEGSMMANNFIVWEADAVSETTGMAEASYEDWMALHNIYKYCRGATVDRPSWAFSYGYSDDDAQLVMASAIAAQNNPYELRVPKMTTTVGIEFRGMMYNWIKQYSKQIFRSRSLAPVVVLYSERNRDFLDGLHAGGIFFSPTAPGRDRKWLGSKGGSPEVLKYMGDYRGLNILLYQYQIPSDIYPFSRVNGNLLQRYRVIVLPCMAIMTEDEKEMLLQAVYKGATLIVSGDEPGKWDAEGDMRKESLWKDIIADAEGEGNTRYLGEGRICFLDDRLGQEYLKSRDRKIATPFLNCLNDAGIEPWVSINLPVVIEAYTLERQTILHVLNYSWVGSITNKAKRLPLELSIPRDLSNEIEEVIQSEPQWDLPKKLSFSEKEGKLIIPLEVGINALVVINKNKS